MCANSNIYFAAVKILNTTLLHQVTRDSDKIEHQCVRRRCNNAWSFYVWWRTWNYVHKKSAIHFWHTIHTSWILPLLMLWMHFLLHGVCEMWLFLCWYLQLKDIFIKNNMIYFIRIHIYSERYDCNVKWQPYHILWQPIL